MNIENKFAKGAGQAGGNNTRVIPPHGGYRKLRSFQVAELVYDATVVFCNRFVDKRSCTHDQMVQAARSGRHKAYRQQQLKLKAAPYQWKTTKI